MWVFVLVNIVILHLEGFGTSFVGYIIYFVVALVSTLAVEAFVPGKLLKNNQM